MLEIVDCRAEHGFLEVVLTVCMLISVAFLGMVLLPSQDAAGADGGFGGGNGASDNPFLIEDVWDLQNMSANLGAYYALTGDIDAYITVGWNAGAGFAPIGTEATPFTGTLDGRNHTINGLYINRPLGDNIGLIGYKATAGKLENIVLADVNITGRNAVGGLVGYSRLPTTNCHVSGKIAGVDAVSGLVGYQYYGQIRFSSSSAEVTGSGNNVGGILGGGYSYTVSDSFSTGDVTGLESTGGLVGYIRGAVERSFATGNVTGQTNVGGLGGYIYDTWSVRSCYATGNVRGNSKVGGLVGLPSYGAWIEDSYSSGTVSRISGTEQSIGGLVGLNYQSRIHRCYSTGRVIFENDADPTDKGICGNANTGGNYQMFGNYWDMETSQQTTTAGNATGKTTEEMMTKTTFTDSSWDMDAVWWMRNLRTYPRLRAVEPFDIVNTDTGLDYETMQGAIDAPETLDGHTIAVAAGTYDERFTISKRLTIQGAGMDNTTIHGGNSGSVITITSDWVNLTGFKITGSGTTGTTPNCDAGIKLNNVHNCTITNNNITGNRNGVNINGGRDHTISWNQVWTSGYDGIFADASTHLRIHNNTVSGFSDSGIWLRGASSYPVVDNNTVRSGPYGIYLGQVSNLVGVVMKRNTVTWTTNNGMYLYSCIGADVGWNTLTSNTGNGMTIYVGSGNVVHNSTISRNIESGVRIYNSQSNWIAHNLFEGNTATSQDHAAVYLYYYTSPHNNKYNIIEHNVFRNNTQNGVMLRYADYNTIRNNYFENNSKAASGYPYRSAIHLYQRSHYNTIANNTMHDNRIGMGSEFALDNNVWDNNTVRNSTSSGMVLSYAFDNTIKFNTIQDSGGGGISMGNSQRNTFVRNNILSNVANGISFSQGGQHSILNNTITGNGLSGVNMTGSNVNKVDLCILDGNNISDNSLDGVSLWDSTSWSYHVYNTNLTNNIISGNGRSGIAMAGGTYGNTVMNNIIRDNTGHGVGLIKAPSNRIFNNTLENNDDHGIHISSTSNNRIYHNSIIGNTNQAYDDGSNIWNLSYHLGGNYWSHYTIPDIRMGPEQDIPGWDEIVDFPLSMPGGGLDQYPWTIPMGWDDPKQNHAPKITTPNVLNAYRGVLYHVEYQAVDDDLDPLTWQLSTDASWLSIDPSTGILSGTPNNNSHLGYFYVNIIVSDGRGSTDFTNFTLFVEGDWEIHWNQAYQNQNIVISANLIIKEGGKLTLYDVDITVFKKVIIQNGGYLKLVNCTYDSGGIMVMKNGVLDTDPSTIVANGDIYIDGTMILHGDTLVMNCSHNGEYNIYVNESGRLVVSEGAKITSSGILAYQILASENSTLSIVDSTVEYCGWEMENPGIVLVGWENGWITGWNVTITGSTFMHGYAGGVVCKGNNITLIIYLEGQLENIESVETIGSTGLVSGIARKWSLTTTMTTFEMDAIFRYDNEDLPASIFSNHKNSLVPYCYNGETWVQEMGTEVINNPESNTVTLRGLTHFTDFTLGGSGLSCTSVSPDAVTTDMENVAMLKLDLDLADADILRAVNITFVGPREADVSLVRLYIDNGDGIFDPGFDALLGTDTFGGVVITPDHPLAPGSHTLWIAYDISDTAILGNTVGASIAAGDLWLDTAGSTISDLTPSGNPQIKAGLWSPFTLYGQVKDADENLAPSVLVTIDNRETGEVVTTTTNAWGEYYYDLGTTIYGYSNGDTIIVNATWNTLEGNTTSLIVISGFGHRIDVVVLDVIPPTANGGDDKVVVAGTMVELDGSSSTDDSGIINYTWTFNNGTDNITLYGETAEYTFTLVGNYSVVLNVTDDAGNWNTDTVNISVIPGPIYTITISPASTVSVLAGENLWFTVEACDEYGNLNTTNPMVFTWENASSGLFNELFSGDYEVIASHGSVYSPMTIVTVLYAVHTYSFLPGWNMVGVPFLNAMNGTDSFNTASSFGVSSTVKAVVSWDPVAQEYAFFIVGFTSSPEKNFALNLDEGYWVWDSDASEINITGDYAGERNASLRPGWNLLGYAGLNTGDVGTDWAPQVNAGAADAIARWNSALQSFEYYHFPSDNMSLETGRAYFIWSDFAVVLVYMK